MSEKNELRVIIFRYGVTDWMASMTTIIAIAGMSIANHRWGGGSTWIDALAVVLGFLSIVALATARDRNAWRGPIDQAIEHLKTLQEKNG